MEPKLKEILHRVLQVDCNSLSANQGLVSWGVSSIKMIKLFIEIEKEFKIIFEDEFFDLKNISLRDIEEYLNKKISL